ncbi:sensor histidine kinase [Rhodococcus sp. MEB041]|uniref:sensor histidine kinase n=1 Tax=Rhodococcus sp. MEB041 TaxID=3040323 RepID=UPI00254F9B6A|nr:sensor histidine kinase [Rhodococcus sp. MEB041]
MATETTSGRRRRATDIAIAAAVFAYNLPVQGTSSPLELIVPVGLCLPFVWRRRHPVGSFAVVIAAAHLQVLLGLGPLVADVMVVFSLFAVASARAWQISLPAAVVAAGWTLLVTLPDREANDLSPGDVGLLVATMAVAWLIGTLARTRRLYVQSLEERAAQAERERETGTRMAVLGERTRIARELHDVVSHSLSAIVLLSEGAASIAHADPDRAAEAMRSVRDTSRGAMSEMRSMLTVLRSDDDPVGPQPGLDRIDALLDESRAVGIPVVRVDEGTPRELGAGAAAVVYRVIQEALTNVRKHAGEVHDVRVSLCWNDDGVDIRVVDDGKSGTGTWGLGLIGMRERVEAQGGDLEVGPTDSGFGVHARLPVPR